MCGIAGYIDLQHSLDNAEQLIDSMCQIIRHRGPDEQGIWTEQGVALGTRRLSIIDLAGGQQPIFNEDRSVLVVFNGEIYNYRELQKTLQERGHSFATRSDTEVIVHAYEEYGDDCVKHLRGMFTFAIWDRRRQRLLAARDRFGKKPLNYYWDGQRLIFGSEIKSLLQAGITREVNPLALDEYLVYGYVPTPLTLFKNVWKLPAAHILIYEDGQISTKRYWELPFTATCQDDEATAIERICVLLQDAVRVRLMSEVPLGAFLSGGVDSSAVVGMMSSMMTQPVKTFSIGFEDDVYNELPYARKIAKHFGTDHSEFLIRPDLVSVLPQLVWAYDEPFGDSSMLPTYYVSKLAREHVTVALTGDGGDEIFGGYRLYERELSISRMPKLVRYVLGYGATLLPDGIRGKRRFGALHLDPATRRLQATMRFPASWRSSMYNSDYFAQVHAHDPYERLLSEFRTGKQLDNVTLSQYVDVRTYLTDDILVKVDKASMINSLETRTPLLDQHLAEYVTSLPSTLRMRSGVLKYLLKKVAVGMVPTEILSRPKQGFAVPIERWFRGELATYARELLDSREARQRGIFNQKFINKLLQAHANTRLVNYSGAIWPLLCLELWFQVYMDESPIAPDREQIQVTSNR